jgi:hypothetical protein
MSESKHMNMQVPKVLQDTGGHFNWKTAFEFLSRFVLLIVVGLLGYGLDKVSEIEDQVEINTTDLAVINDSRFTATDGLKMMLTIEGHLRDIRDQDATQPSREEVQEMLDRLARQLRRDGN